MAPFCSSMEVLNTRKCPILGTRSVRRASGLLETGYPDRLQSSTSKWKKWRQSSQVTRTTPTAAGKP
jgi:hypothetical protein